MVESKRDSGKIGAVMIYGLVALVLLLQYRGDFSYQETELFIALIMAYLWMGGCLVIAKIRHNLIIFEPLTFVSALYMSIFILKPIADLNTNSMYAHGHDVLGGGLKATFLVTAAYTCMYLGYYGKRFVKFRIEKSVQSDNLVPKKSVLDNLMFLYILWAIAFACCMICLLSQGISLQYVFSFGQQGEKIVDESNTALLFLSNFGVTLITVWLIIINKSANKLIKVVITLLMTIYLIMRNGRWLILVMILAPVTYHYLKKKKTPKMLIVLGGGIIMLMIFAWMQVNRANIAAGAAMEGWGDEGLTLELLLGPLESDLGTYKTFYAMVENYPSIHKYLLGATFAYAAILFVPRALWRGKPDNPVRDMIENCLGTSARKSGTAVANIGEMYANFGPVGCMVMMFFLGRILSVMKRSLMTQTDDRLFMYSMLYPLLFQWIARGNFSGNFYMTIFAMLPFIISAIIKRVRWR